MFPKVIGGSCPGPCRDYFATHRGDSCPTVTLKNVAKSQREIPNTGLELSCGMGVLLSVAKGTKEHMSHLTQKVMCYKLGWDKWWNNVEDVFDET